MMSALRFDPWTEINLIEWSHITIQSIRDGKNPGFFRKTHWGGFNWFYTGLMGKMDYSKISF